MDYNFKDTTCVNVYMDRSNTQMIYECYSGDRLLRSGFFGSGLKPIEIYNFLDAVFNSGASLVIGDGENGLEETLNADSIFFQN